MRKNLSAMGFTLVELAVVIVVVGVLAAFGVPRFKIAVEKSKALEAFNYLSAIQEAQERYFGQNHTYSSDVTKLDLSHSTPAYFSAPLMSGDENTWTATVTRTGKTTYGSYTVVFTPDGFSQASTIVDEINPEKQ